MIRLGLLLLLLSGCSAATTQESKSTSEPSSTNPVRGGVDWPLFLGPTQNSVSPEKGILTSWPKEGLKILWEAELGLGYAPPTIADGKLFHADRIRDKIRTTCRDANTGKVLWTHEYDTQYDDLYGYESGPRACPIFSDGMVYTYGPEGMLVAIDAKTGKEIWKSDTAREYNVVQNFFGVGSVPTIEGDLLIVAVGGSPKGEQPDDFRKLQGNNSGIVAFDKKTGKVKYQLSDELGSYSSPIVAAIGDQRLGLYFGRGGLLGFDPKSGKQSFYYKWRARALESVNAANPVVIGEQIFITECYEKGASLVKLESGKIKEVWNDEEGRRDEKRLMCHWNTPIHHDGYVYGSSGRHEPQAELRCVRLSDGEVIWSQPELSRCSLTMIDDHFLCLNERGLLMLLKVNPKKFELVTQWQIPNLRYPTWAAPIVSHGKLYLRGKGRLICCELIPSSK